MIKLEQHCCTLGRVVGSSFTLVTREGSAGAAVPWSYRTRTRPRGHNVLHKWPWRNAADSSPINRDVLRAGFWLGCAADLLPEAKEADFVCAGCWHFGRPVWFYTSSHIVKGGSCFIFSVTLKNNSSLHA